MLPIVHVIARNKLRWFGRVMRREEVNNEGKRWLNNIDSYLRGKNTPLNRSSCNKVSWEERRLEDFHLSPN